MSTPRRQGTRRQQRSPQPQQQVETTSGSRRTSSSAKSSPSARYSQIPTWSGDEKLSKSQHANVAASAEHSLYHATAIYSHNISTNQELQAHLNDKRVSTRGHQASMPLEDEFGRSQPSTNVKDNLHDQSFRRRSWGRSKERNEESAAHLSRRASRLGLPELEKGLLPSLNDTVERMTQPAAVGFRPITTRPTIRSPHRPPQASPAHEIPRNVVPRSPRRARYLSPSKFGAPVNDICH